MRRHAGHTRGAPRQRRLFAAAALAGAVFGCAVGPDYQRPAVDAPGAYRGQEPPTPESIADLAWWELFEDPVLQGLIEQALAANYDLATAVARVEQARGGVMVARSEMFPAAGYEGLGQRQESFLGIPGISSSGPVDLFAGVFNLAWEIDVWGRIRRATEAARAQLLATDDVRRGVVLSLVTGVAQAYFELRELDLELAIARRTTESFTETLQLFERQYTGGVGTLLAVARAQAAQAQAAAAIPDLEIRIVEKENEISVLLGREPGPIARGLPLLEQPLMPRTPAGLPSEILSRRPDVMQAEEELVAANAEIGVAIANFLPRFGLTSFYGAQSSELAQVLEGTSPIWSAGGEITGPLFQGGALLGAYESAVAAADAARAQYRQTVLVALQEVSNALVAEERLAEVRAQQAVAVRALQDAVDLATKRYVGGLASYFEVLEAQQQLFPAENALAQTDRDRLLVVVQLYRALGGGWKQEPDPEGLNPFPYWP